MSQFGGSPRDQDYGFFTTPARTAVSTSQFGSTAVDTKPAPRPAASPGSDERPTPAFGLPAPAHRAEPERSRSRLVLPMVLLLLVALAAGGALAYQNGMIPGLNQPVPEEPVVVLPVSPYVVAAPDQVLGWQRSGGSKAQQISAQLSEVGAFPDDAVTFVYVTGKDNTALYGAVFAQRLSKADQRDYLSDATRGLRRASPSGTLGAFTDRPAGDLGGVFRCATLQTKPASTTCLFTSRDTSGVLTVVGQTGKPAVDDARAAREALITRR